MPSAPTIESILEKCAQEPVGFTVVEMPGERMSHYTGDEMRAYFVKVVHVSPVWSLIPMLSGLTPIDLAFPHVASWSLRNDKIELYYDHQRAGIYLRRTPGVASTTTHMGMRLFIPGKAQPPDFQLQFFVPDSMEAYLNIGDIAAWKEDLKAFHCGLNWLNQWFRMPPITKKAHFYFQPTHYIIHETQVKQIVSPKSKTNPLLPLLKEWGEGIYKLLQQPVSILKLQRASPGIRQSTPRSVSSSRVLQGSPTLEAVPGIRQSTPRSVSSSRVLQGSPVLEKPEEKQMPPKTPPSLSIKLKITKKTGQTMNTVFEGKATMAMVAGTYESKVKCAIGESSNCFTIESLAKKPQSFSVSPRNTALYNLLNALMDTKSGRVFQGVYLIPSLNFLVVESKKAIVPRARPEYDVFEIKKSKDGINYSPQPNIIVRR